MSTSDDEKVANSPRHRDPILVREAAHYNAGCWRCVHNHGNKSNYLVWGLSAKKSKLRSPWKLCDFGPVTYPLWSPSPHLYVCVVNVLEDEVRKPMGAIKPTAQCIENTKWALVIIRGSEWFISKLLKKFYNHSFLPSCNFFKEIFMCLKSWNMASSGLSLDSVALN